MLKNWMRANVFRLAAALAVVTIISNSAQAQVRRADFNGDSYGDLAIGAPGESGGRVGSGIVHILYGTRDMGLHAYSNQVLYPWSNGMSPSDYLGRFGSALAWGDFNGDELTDLAVGMPDYAQSRDLWGGRGAVKVYYGHQSGLKWGTVHFFSRGNSDLARNLPGVSGEDDYLGTSLAVGDFNGDTYMDLAIGVPQGHITFSGEGAGEVVIVYGGPAGLDATNSWGGADLRSQASYGVPGSPESGDKFGFSLAAGNFGHGPEDDLAIGVPGENNGAGYVNILYGSGWGLTLSNAQGFQQGTAGLPGGPEAGDHFGFALAAGDFNLNGYADLAIGSPMEDIGSENAGVVHVLFGGPLGLDLYFGQAFGQDWGDFDLPGGAESHDLFGWSLAAGNFGKDSAADLAVGVPGDNINGTATGGAVNVIYGSFFDRLTVTGNQLWAQTNIGSGDLGGGTENGDRFGYSLAALDVGRGSRADLVVGVPGESIGDKLEAGAVNVIYSTAAGLSSSNNQVWHQDSVSNGYWEVEGVAEANDHFGYSLSGADSSVNFLLPIQ